MPDTQSDNDTPATARHLAPLDRRELRRERAGVASSSGWPISLILILGGAVALFVFNIPPGYILIAILLALALRWLIRYRSKSPKIRREITEILITEENSAENDKLVTEMRHLSYEGFDGYAITLGKFLQHKRHIETQLHEGSGGSAQQKQVAGLVDSICFGVAELFQSVASIEKRLDVLRDSRGGEEFKALTADRRELLSQVIDAYKTLKKTRQDLPFILDPSAASAVKKPEGDLQGLVDQLRREEEIARNTRARMRRDNI